MSNREPVTIRTVTIGSGTPFLTSQLAGLFRRFRIGTEK